MSQRHNNPSNGPLIVVILGVALLFVVLKGFADMLGLPMNVAADVLIRSTVALVVAVGAGWLLFENHRHWLWISLCVLLAGLSIALWPALDVWAVADPVYAFLDMPGMEQELLFWGGGWARAFYLLAPLAGAAGLFVRNQHY